MPNWLPLESNPEVLTKFIHNGGVSKKWALVDVVGFEPELLEWVPKPVKSFIFLFPCSEAYEKHRAEENDRLKEKGVKYPEDLFYMRQVTPNACGTVAVIHAVANNKDVTLTNGFLKNFIDGAKDSTPEERGKALEADEAFTMSHQETAQEGQTTADPNEKVIHHFVAFINKDGVLYELDGRKSFPIQHGDTTDETFVLDAAKVCKEFMARDPQEVRFTAMALVPAEQ